MIYGNDNPFAGYELAEHLMDCIEPYLAMTSSGVPDRMCILSGEAADDECECGQFAVTGNQQYESADFPTPWTGEQNQGVGKCGPPLFVYQYTLSISRCAPISDDENAPPCPELNAATRVVYEDAWAVRTGLMCCLCAGIKRNPVTGIKAFERYWVGPQENTTPQGGCQGSRITVAIAVMNGGYPCQAS